MRRSARATQALATSARHQAERKRILVILWVPDGKSLQTPSWTTHDGWGQQSVACEIDAHIRTHEINHGNTVSYRRIIGPIVLDLPAGLWPA
jgi:hypothetical protein